MSTITALVGTDGITTANSMTKINTNFSNLNTDKIETSVIDSDTALTANSDTKIATQKAVKTYVDALSGQTYLVPTGAIVPYGKTIAPSNFLLCDGTAVSRSTYATLFGIIGTTFGVGDGSTTFNLPTKKTTHNSQICFDSGSTSSSASATSFTQAHTTSGANRLLIVGIENSGLGITTPTYNGVSMTALTTISGTQIMWFYLMNPTLGTNNIAGTFGSGQYNCVAVSYNNIKQTSALDAQVVTGSASVQGITFTSTKNSPPDLTVVFAEQLAANGTPIYQGIISRQESQAQTRVMTIGDLTNGNVSGSVTFGGTATSWGAIASFLVANTVVSTFDIIKT